MDGRLSVTAGKKVRPCYSPETASSIEPKTHRIGAYCCKRVSAKIPHSRWHGSAAMKDQNTDFILLTQCVRAYVRDQKRKSANALTFLRPTVIRIWKK